MSTVAVVRIIRQRVPLQLLLSCSNAQQYTVLTLHQKKSTSLSVWMMLFIAGFASIYRTNMVGLFVDCFVFLVQNCLCARFIQTNNSAVMRHPHRDTHYKIYSKCTHCIIKIVMNTII